jgi:type IV secretory pathway VirB10-like protein
MRNARLAGMSAIQTVVLIVIVVIVIVIIIRAGSSKKGTPEPVTAIDKPPPSSVEPAPEAVEPMPVQEEETPVAKQTKPTPVQPTPEPIEVTSMSEPDPEAEEEPETPQKRTSRQMRTIRFAMLAFQRERGRLPSEEEFGQSIFTDLLDPEVEINSEGFPVDSWGNPLKFNPSMGVAFGFLSTGPDGKSGTRETDSDNVR